MADQKISALPNVLQAQLDVQDYFPIVHAGVTSRTTIAAACSAFLASIGMGGTVSSVSVVTANGFAGTVATATSTPTITLTTTITGVLKGNGTAISAAVAGTDYTTPTGSENLSNKTIASPVLSGTATGTYTLGGTPSITQPTINGFTEGVVAIGNSGTAKTLVITAGTVQTVTMTGNCTFTMPTATTGKSFTLIVNTGAGSFTGTFTSVKWPSGNAPTLTATASRWDIFSFFADGTNWYGNYAQGYA